VTGGFGKFTFFCVKFAQGTVHQVLNKMSCFSPPPSLAPIKPRMSPFWYRLTQVHLEKIAVNVFHRVIQRMKAVAQQWCAGCAMQEKAWKRKFDEWRRNGVYSSRELAYPEFASKLGIACSHCRL